MLPFSILCKMVSCILKEEVKHPSCFRKHPCCLQGKLPRLITKLVILQLTTFLKKKDQKAWQQSNWSVAITCRFRFVATLEYWYNKPMFPEFWNFPKLYNRIEEFDEAKYHIISTENYVFISDEIRSRNFTAFKFANYFWDIAICKWASGEVITWLLTFGFNVDVSGFYLMVKVFLER